MNYLINDSTNYTNYTDYTYLNNEYVITTLLLFLSVYTYMLQMKVPQWLSNLFKNDIFRVIYISLLLMIPFQRAPHVAIIVALVFVITLHFINRDEAIENMKKIVK